MPGQVARVVAELALGEAAAAAAASGSALSPQGKGHQHASKRQGGDEITEVRLRCCADLPASPLTMRICRRGPPRRHTSGRLPAQVHVLVSCLSVVQGVLNCELLASLAWAVKTTANALHRAGGIVAG